ATVPTAMAPTTASGWTLTPPTPRTPVLVQASSGRPSANLPVGVRTVFSAPVSNRKRAGLPSTITGTTRSGPASVSSTAVSCVIVQAAAAVATRAAGGRSSGSSTASRRIEYLVGVG